MNNLRKGQKLINYLRKKFYDADNIEQQDNIIRRTIFNMSDTEFDIIANMSDEDCWNKVYNNNNLALSDKLLKEVFREEQEK